MIKLEETVSVLYDSEVEFVLMRSKARLQRAQCASRLRHPIRQAYRRQALVCLVLSHNSSGLSGTLWEASSSSPENAASVGRFCSASSAEIFTTSGLLFSCDMWAITR